MQVRFRGLFANLLQHLLWPRVELCCNLEIMRVVRLYLCLVGCLPLTGGMAAPLPPYSEAAVQAWWRAQGETADFPAEAENLKSMLRERQQGSADLSAVTGHPDFLGWLELAAWLDLFPREAAGGFFHRAEGRRAFVRTGALSPLRRLFFAHLSPFDDAAKAAEILCRICESDPDRVKQHPQVAVAFALVWDQPFPDQWPHLWTRKEALPIGDADPVKRFAVYFKIQAGIPMGRKVRKLMLDPSRLTARELMFVVDTPVETREMEYILQVDLEDPRRLNDLFQAVPYDAGRMNRGELQWPHGGYRLIDIGKKGGICADQAYFVAMAGKAQGLPTVLLMGQGSTGGHAWVGYMGSPGQWMLDVARYDEQNFVSGTAWDPQTWKRITDAQLLFLTKAPASEVRALRGRLLTRWALMNRGEDYYPRLLGLAREAWPRSFDIWELQAACLEERHLPFEARRAFWENWVSTFREDRDMRFKGQTEILRLHEARGDIRRADQLRAQMTLENKSGRFDLAISLAAAPVLDLAGAGKWPEAQKAYATVLQQFKQQSGGILFYNLVQPFVDRALQAGRQALAKEALAAAKPLFKIEPLSTVAVDFKNLETMAQKP